MAEVPITINGVICDLYGRTITGPIKLVGSASITGLGVGGGPIIPPDGGGGGGDKPPGIWGGGNEPFPTPPIANVPGAPGYRPPVGIWPGPGDPDFPGGGKPPDIGPPPGGGDSGSPTHPINLPPDALGDTGFWHETYAPKAGGWVWVWVPFPQPGASK